jgi:hypothetical protein
MQDFEKLGAFYLGRVHDLPSGQNQPDPLLYDSKDLTTHAVCVGMTGSGKTGLCLSLLEEAAIDGIPAIAIDPKGDLGNLLLTFPELRPEDFRPWIDEREAQRQGMSADEFAAATAEQWRKGLAEWGQTPDRIARFRDSVDTAIYTPGSTAGLPLTVLRSFAAPSAELVADADAFRERISASVSGLLALLGIAADPLRSREHILLSNLLDRAWRQGRSLDPAALIREIQTPPLEKVGILDLESFYPAPQRFELAMSLNNLLASPSFAGWMTGESLDIKRLLYTTEGRPRLSILSIAHLSESERMFFVTILLNEVLSWIRSQPGTSSLRALLYMDEVFGYFPPTANPPSKTPMLTLLKQARAYGLGVVLATQNPVDLDYKGLSNTGTWFLGRLQTERDKARVLEGLEGASTAAGASFDRAKMEATLAGLGKRVFLMNNVHEDQPVVFQTRWALSYLRGPLTRGQIQDLMAARKNALPATGGSANQAGDSVGAASPSANAAAASAVAASPVAAMPAAVNPPLEPSLQPSLQPSGSQADQQASEPPLLPPGVPQRFLACSRPIAAGQRLVYRPALWGQAKLHFVRATYKVDCWQERSLLANENLDSPGDVWEAATQVDPDSLDWDDQPQADGQFSALPSSLASARTYKSLATALKNSLYQGQTLTVYKCGDLKLYSEAGETEGDFRIRLSQQAKEKRDEDVEKLRKKYTGSLATIQDRLRAAKEKVDRERSQFQSKTVQSAISLGTSVLGALFGRKLLSATNVNRAGSAIRTVGRAADERGDIARAEEGVEALQQKLQALETEFKQQVDELEQATRADQLELEPLEVRPRKSDIGVEPIALVWTPWRVDSSGIAEPAWSADVQEK